MENWQYYPSVNGDADPADWRVDHEPEGARDHPIVAWAYEEKHARLIAAAPELLAALEGLARYVENSGEAWASLPEWQAASAALAKARGA